MTRVLAFVPVVAALALGGCGGSSPSNSASNGPGAGRFFSAKVQACLKKQGVTIPSFRGRRNGGRPPGGGTTPYGPPPTGTTPNGGPPAGGPRGGRFGARSQKFLKALKACGVTLPQGRPGGPPPQGATTPQQTN